MMTSFLEYVPASATNWTSCHTTDGDEDVNRDLYFVSIVGVIDVFSLSSPPLASFFLSLPIYQKQ